MKIKLDTINQELTYQQTSDIYEELKELFESRTNFSPPPPPDPLPYQYDPMRVTYGPGTSDRVEWRGVEL